jgi:hypothetical protein
VVTALGIADVQMLERIAPVLARRDVPSMPYSVRDIVLPLFALVTIEATRPSRDFDDSANDASSSTPIGRLQRLEPADNDKESERADSPVSALRRNHATSAEHAQRSSATGVRRCVSD